MNKRWTIALGVTSLYGAVAACGAFGTESPVGGTTSSSSSSGGGGLEAGGDGPTGCVPETLGSDPRHCGRCDHSCLGGLCAAGQCLPSRFASVTGAGYIRQTATDLFVVSNDGVVRVPKSGEPPKAVITGVVAPLGVAVGEDRVYCASAVGGIYRSALDGAGGTQQVVDRGASEVAVLGDLLFSCAVGSEDLLRHPPAGEKAEKVAKDIGGCESIGFHSDQVIFGGPALARVPRLATSNSPVRLDPRPTRRLLVEGDTVYSLAYDRMSVARRTLAGADASADLPAGKQKAGWGDLALDDTHVYWITGERPSAGTGNQHVEGAVHRVRKDGTAEPETLVQGVVPGGVAVDEVAIYWSDFKSGQVFRLAK